MLILSSWSEQFRSDIGFNGVSQIWGGRPAWYFWLADSPGVYQLEMMNTEEDLDTIEDRCTAVFNVKCYPYQERSEFQSFSFLERKLVQSKLAKWLEASKKYIVLQNTRPMFFLTKCRLLRT
jgi:hypothetical protein